MFNPYGGRRRANIWTHLQSQACVVGYLDVEGEPIVRYSRALLLADSSARWLDGTSPVQTRTHEGVTHCAERKPVSCQYRLVFIYLRRKLTGPLDGDWLLQ